MIVYLKRFFSVSFSLPFYPPSYSRTSTRSPQDRTFYLLLLEGHYQERDEVFNSTHSTYQSLPGAEPRQHDSSSRIHQASLPTRHCKPNLLLLQLRRQSPHPPLRKHPPRPRRLTRHIRKRKRPSGLARPANRHLTPKCPHKPRRRRSSSVGTPPIRLLQSGSESYGWRNTSLSWR